MKRSGALVTCLVIAQPAYWAAWLPGQTVSVDRFTGSEESMPRFPSSSVLVCEGSVTDVLCVFSILFPTLRETKTEKIRKHFSDADETLIKPQVDAFQKLL